ncbi:MAG: hypothetical protein ACK554_14230 [Erythrobacteraceae bacterium]|jgi:hypothetical protein
MRAGMFVFMQDEHDQPTPLAPDPIAAQIYPVAQVGIHTPAGQHELSEQLTQMEYDQ